MSFSMQPAYHGFYAKYCVDWEEMLDSAEPKCIFSVWMTQHSILCLLQLAITEVVSVTKKLPVILQIRLKGHL